MAVRTLGELIHVDRNAKGSQATCCTPSWLDEEEISQHVSSPDIVVLVCCNRILVDNVVKRCFVEKMKYL